MAGEIQQLDIQVDKETFKKQVNIFVDHHRRKQEEPEFREKRKNQSLEELIEDYPLLSDDAVEVFFDPSHQYKVSPEVVDEVHNVLKKMQKRVNKLPSIRRFFILETINFFSSKISLGKLIPALLILDGDDQKKAICEFTIPTFLSINKNVETLVNDSRLFTKKNLHVDRGGLYTFVADLAKTLIRLFKDDFLEQFGEFSSPVEFFQSAFNPNTFRLKSSVKSDSEYVYQEMIAEAPLIRQVTLDFVSIIQSHDALFNYSRKRHTFYKLFLLGLTGQGRFKDVDPIDISRILAGCLMANDQLRPDNDLIDDMIDEKTFALKSTTAAKKEFINQLSPTTVHKLISRMKVSLQHISKSNFSEEFQEVQRLSVINILKNIWIGFIRLIDKGIITVTEPINVIINQIKKTYDSFLRDEKQKVTDEIARISSRKGTLRYMSGQPIPKNLESFAIMTQHFDLVELDIIGFRGLFEGGTHKDFNFNSKIFRHDEKVLVQYYSCFQKWFKASKKKRKVAIISYVNQRKIKECFAAYTFGRYLFCLGVTHLKTANTTDISEKDLFPYVVLFVEEPTKKFGRVLSRELVLGEKLKIYNEVEFSEEMAIYFYEPLYLLLHLLPEKNWRAKDTQMCVSFLVKELRKLKKKHGKLLYCVNLPILSD